MSARLIAIAILTLTIWTTVFVLDMPTVNAAPLGIINGRDVQSDEQLGVVGLLLADVDNLYDAQFCGGTLIDAEWVLTAAHCTFDLAFSPFAAADLDVIVGSQQLHSGLGERIAVDRIVRHHNFDFETYYNDIALLHLAKAAAMTPVAVVDADANLDTDATLGLVLGWGVMKSGFGATTLQQAELPIVAQQDCASFYARQGYHVIDSILCAGYRTGGIDACAGDSGGPMMVWDEAEEVWVQVGIISAGAGCAEPGYFGLYTRLSDFAEWITQTTESEPIVVSRLRIYR
ncbi:MAG: serine protease [Caldilineaceae bacterium]